MNIHDVGLGDGAEHVVPDDGDLPHLHHLLSCPSHVLQEQEPAGIISFLNTP
jgi:hypothetical protein